ncbi:MAG: hypothetical protein EP330_16985 [Deltaproteobacteria bacterium]|nr:MAG: hypothetical protein EP330_16985 [Deltaproteobacteria bacterium]
MLNELLKGKSPRDFSAYDLASKAHFRSSRKQPLEAAVLFDAAAVRAQEEFDAGSEKRNEAGVRINQSLNHRARAGFAFYKAGEVARALPMFEVCVAADWLAAGLNHDLHTVAMCWAYLVRERAREGREAFEAAFAEAVAACHTVGAEFPWAHPTRKEMAELARTHGNEALAQAIVAPLRTTRPMKRDLRTWLKDFDADAP